MVFFDKWRKRVGERLDLQRIDPYKQMMNEEYVRQRPNEDFTGSAFELASQRVREKERQRAMPYSPGQTGDRESMASKYAKEKSGKDKTLESERTYSPVEMTPDGPERLFGRKLKDHIMGQIQKKRQMIAADPYEMKGLTKGELAFEKKWMGISDAKDISLSNMFKLEDRAVDELGARLISEGTAIKSDDNYYTAGDKPKQINFSAEQIQSIMPEIIQRYFPKASPEKQEAAVEKINKSVSERWIPEYGLSLPEGMNDGKSIFTFLTSPPHNKDPKEVAELIISWKNKIGVE